MRTKTLAGVARRWWICFIICAVALIGWLFHIRQLLVDLNSGMERNRVSIFGLSITDRKRSTPFSLALAADDQTISVWRLVQESGPLRPISPHFSQHETPTMFLEATLIGDMSNESPDALKEKYIELLTLVKKGDHQAARRLLDDWGLDSIRRGDLIPILRCD